MADKTLGIKITEEVYDKAKATIETSSLTAAKDWIEKAVALYELHSVKDGISGDYSNHLAELEVHTTRIYTLISNMMTRSTYLKDHAVKEVTDKLASKEDIINELHEQQQTLASEHAQTLAEKLTAMQNALDNSEALITAYKEKNDTLNGLLTTYRGYADDNECLQAALVTTKAELTEQATANEQLACQLNEAEQLLAKTNDEHKTALNILAEKKDIEREKALVSHERAYQGQLTAANEKIRALYDEIAQLRTSYEQQIDALKQDVEDE